MAKKTEEKTWRIGNKDYTAKDIIALAKSHKKQGIKSGAAVIAAKLGAGKVPTEDDIGKEESGEKAGGEE